MEEKMSIRTFLQEFDNGAFKSPDVKTQIKAGWYDWFCKNTSLAKKTENLAKKLKRIANSNLINQDTQYVFFKNNSPMVGSLYDSFSICDMETGDVVWWITPKSGHKRDGGKAQLSGSINGFKEHLVEGTWQDVVNYFKNGGEQYEEEQCKAMC